MKKEIKGKWALITGSSSGIGKDFAEILAEKGCNLILVARNIERMEEIKKNIQKKHSVQVEIISMDLSQRESPEALFQKVVNDKKIDVEILINNAGYGIHAWFKDIPWAEEEKMLDLLINNLVHITKLFLPGMLERKSGRILLVSSVGAFQPTPTYATYASAKSFVLNFGITLNYELRKTGVTCTVLCPGVTFTGFQETAGHTESTLFMKLTKMTSRKVAEIGIRKMFKGRSFTVSGVINAVSARVEGIAPKRLLAVIALWAMGTPKK